MTDEPEASYGLVMPFVVCQSVGGPYDDAAFVAGVRMKAIDHVLASGITKYESYEPPGLVPQLDLVAMQHGYALTIKPYSDEWSYCMFARSEAEQ